MGRAKVVCTLGPASDDRKTIRGLIDAGMSVARLNASHGETDHRATIIDRVRGAAEQAETSVATMLDIPGPEIRTAPASDLITLDQGSEWQLVEGDTVDRENRILGVSTSVSAVQPGDRVLLDDGRIETTVKRVDDGDVLVTVHSGGSIGGRKGVNVPGVDLGLNVVTETDRAECRLAAEKSVPFVAASFVGDADDIYMVRDALEEFGSDALIIAKIERADAVENLEGIIDVADGIMVARGDLGVECPLEQVPLIQKRIIRKAGAAGIPVITATEMLTSMTEEKRPTRAEASDVANAVLDGTDAVMLSGETAIGDHPIRVVETMESIICDVEASEEYDQSRERRVPPASDTQIDALARSARYLARDVGATAIVAVTESGFTARKVAKYLPAVPVVAVTPDDAVRKRLALTWGVHLQHQSLSEDNVTELVGNAVTAALRAGVAESGDTIVVLAGMMTELEGTNTTNTLKVHLAAEVLANGRGIVGGRAAGSVFFTEDGDIEDCPRGAVVVLPDSFDSEFSGDTSKISAIVSAERSMTGFPALVARELNIPMVGDVSLSVEDGLTVTVDGERGVVYESEISSS